MKRILKLMARLYPSGWRKRYGAEYEALLEDAEPHVRDVADVLWEATNMRLASRSFVRIVLPCALAGMLAAVAMSLVLPVRYSSRTEITQVTTYDPPSLVDDSGQTVATASVAHESQRSEFIDLVKGAYSREFLAALIQRMNLYPRERASVSLDRVVDGMQRAILIKSGAHDDSVNRQVSTFTLQFDYPDPRVAQRVNAELVSRLITFTLGLGPKRPPAGSITGDSFRIEHAPSLSLRPSGMGRGELMAMGLLGGVGCGVILAALADRRRGSTIANG
jgi:uncharacterized protein involved in exopolysaccharide biosynthesis